MPDYEEPRWVTNYPYERSNQPVRVIVSGCWQAVTGADHAALRREVLRQFIRNIPGKLTPDALHEACVGACVLERAQIGDARVFDVGPGVDGVPLEEFARDGH